MEEELYLGIDYSLTYTGVCLLNSKGETIYESIKPKEKGIERLFFIYSTVLRIAAKYPQVKHCVVEQYAYGKGGAQQANAGRTFSLGEGGGVLRLALLQKGITVYEASPGTGKKFATGNGNAPGKGVVIKEIYKRWGEDVDNDNLADAFVMAKLCYHKVTDDFEGLTKKQQEAVEATYITYEPRKRKPRG